MGKLVFLHSPNRLLDLQEYCFFDFEFFLNPIEKLLDFVHKKSPAGVLFNYIKSNLGL